MTEQALPVVSSRRLDLVLMTPAFFEHCLADEHEAATTVLGATIDEAWWDETGIMRFWLDQLLVDPCLQPWLARAIVHREDRRMIGHIGFHGRPGMPHLEPYAPGGVEMGYTVFTPYRRQGYATEALEALMRWAAREFNVPSFVLSITPHNVASQALARHFGFIKVGEHEDPEDGLEEVFARPANGA